MKPKLIRVTTVPITMNILLKGQLSFFNRGFEVIGITGYDCKHFNEIIEREGIRMHAIDMKRPISLWPDLKALWKLYRIFKEEKPVIVHSITPKAGLLTMIAAYFAGVPIRMHTFTGLVFPSKTGFYQWILIIMDRLLCFFATNVYPEGEGVKRDLLQYKITRKPLKVIANGNINGVDIENFNPGYVQNHVNFRENFRKEIGIGKADFVYCFVGRITEDKGINELVSSFLKLLKAKPEEQLKLLLVGPFEKENGTLDGKVMRLIKDIPEILAVGRHDDIRPYLLVSDLFVFPSYREGFPNVVLQAGAMGLPCIVSNINGCNEIIIDRENGLIVPAKDETSLFEAMEMLLREDGLRDKMSLAARLRVAAHYEQSMVWDALLEEYNQFMDPEILIGFNRYDRQ